MFFIQWSSGGDTVHKEKHDLTSIAIVVLSVAMCVFEIYTASTAPLQAVPQRAIYLSFMFPIIFLYESGKFKSHGVLRFLFLGGSVLSFITTAYMAFNWLELQNRTTLLITTDYVFAFALIAITLILTWRTIGICMPIIASVFILYAFLGPSLPGIWGFPTITLRRFISCLYCGTEGIWGTCLGAAATYVFSFILFGEFLMRYGAGDYFIEIAEAALGSVRGGTGKIAVITSALFGMISGSPTANVAATGCLTIPMMKKSGYTPEYSGGVVSAAAAGGSIMPPVMGTGAFVMAELIGIPYKKICIAALFPATLYFMALFLMVDLNARKNCIAGSKSTHHPALKNLLLDGWHYLLCIGTLILFLMVLNWSPSKSAMLAIAALVISDTLKCALNKQKISLKKIADTFVGACKGAIPIASATTCAGIIIGAFTATGLNLRLSGMLIQLAGGSTILLLVLAAIGALILGLGLPTTPVYILMAVMIAPALTKMGIEKLSAHLFLFYFGALAPITPPVGTAYFVAAGLARGKPTRTGVIALCTAAVAFLLPFVWIYQPAFLLTGTIPQILWSVFTGTVGTAALAFGLEGYLYKHINPTTRLILVTCAVLIVVPETVSSLLGMLIVAVCILTIRTSIPAMDSGRHESL